VIRHDLVLQEDELRALRGLIGTPLHGIDAWERDEPALADGSYGLFYDLRVRAGDTEFFIAPDEIATPMHDGDHASDWERPTVIVPGSPRETDRRAQAASAEADLMQVVEAMPELNWDDTGIWQFWPIVSALGIIEDVAVLRAAYVIAEVKNPKLLGRDLNLGVEVKLPVGASDWKPVHPDDAEAAGAAEPHLRGFVFADEVIVFRGEIGSVAVATEGYALYIYPDVATPPGREGVTKLLSVREL
jgi:hypothetical protein